MMRNQLLLRRTTGALLGLTMAVAPLLAQGNQDANSAIKASKDLLAKEGYQVPPPDIAKLVLAPRHLNVSLSNGSPDRKHFLREESEGMPSVQTFGKPHVYYGGVQVDRRRTGRACSRPAARWAFRSSIR